MTDKYDDYSREDLIRLIRARDRKPKFGLLWEHDEIDHGRVARGFPALAGIGPFCPSTSPSATGEQRLAGVHGCLRAKAWKTARTGNRRSNRHHPQSLGNPSFNRTAVRSHND